MPRNGLKICFYYKHKTTKQNDRRLMPRNGLKICFYYKHKTTKQNDRRLMNSANKNDFNKFLA